MPSRPGIIAPAGFYPEANIGYGLSEFAAYDPVTPQTYFTRWGGALVVEPDVDSAALAREYGIAWDLQATASPRYGIESILHPTRIHPEPPPGTRYVGSFAGERLYAVPDATRFSLIADRGSGSWERCLP